MSVKNTFPDYVEINAIDMLKDPTVQTSKFFDELFFRTKYLCAKCKQDLSFRMIKNRFKGDCFTIKCGCGVIIIYPKAKDRDNKRLWIHISKDKYKKDYKNEKRNYNTGTASANDKPK